MRGWVGPGTAGPGMVRCGLEVVITGGSMSFLRFVPGFSRHPKRIKCGPISSWLWVCSADYCMTHLTDGFIDAAMVPTLCPTIVGSALKRAVDNLLAVN